MRCCGDARQVYAAFFNAPGPEWVSFGQNMTTITFHLARALARQWGEGDEIVVTELDHHGNVDPWRHAAADAGITIRTVPLAADGVSLDMEALASTLNGRGRGCWRSARHPMRSARSRTSPKRRASRGQPARWSSSTPCTTRRTNWSTCRPSAATCWRARRTSSTGPHQGILCARPELVASLDLPKLRPAPALPPDSLETGTQSHEGIVGAAAAVRFLASVAGPVSPAAGALRDGARRELRATACRRDGADAATVGRAGRHRWRDPLRPSARAATHADRLVCARGTHEPRGGRRTSWAAGCSCRRGTSMPRRSSSVWGMARMASSASAARVTRRPSEIDRLLAAVARIAPA